MKRRTTEGRDRDRGYNSNREKGGIGVREMETNRRIRKNEEKKEGGAPKKRKKAEK